MQTDGPRAGFAERESQVRDEVVIQPGATSCGNHNEPGGPDVRGDCGQQ